MTQKWPRCAMLPLPQFAKIRFAFRSSRSLKTGWNFGPNSLLGFIRSREVFLPLWSALVRCISGAESCPGLFSKTGYIPAPEKSVLIRRLGHLSYEKRLRELRLFPLEKGRLIAILSVFMHTCLGVIKKTEPDFSQWCPVKRQQQQTQIEIW